MTAVVVCMVPNTPVRTSEDHDPLANPADTAVSSGHEPLHRRQPPQESF